MALEAAHARAVLAALPKYLLRIEALGIKNISVARAIFQDPQVHEEMRVVFHELLVNNTGITLCKVEGSSFFICRGETTFIIFIQKYNYDGEVLCRF